MFIEITMFLETKKIECGYYSLKVLFFDYMRMMIMSRGMKIAVFPTYNALKCLWML